MKQMPKSKSKLPVSARAERSVTLLGATGSIGASTIDLIKREPGRYRVEAVSANKSAAALAVLARELNARFAAVGDPTAYRELKDALAGTGIAVGAGADALIEAAQRPAQWVIGAITGAAGLKPTLAAAERGVIVALANKECLVCAGGLFMRRAAACGATVLPVDSEHNALFQAMSAGRRQDVRRVILTASGGLEVIEAYHLFALKPDEIDVLVHPQSIIHGLVEFRDGSLIAQLGSPDMRIPIAHCLAWPDERLAGPAPRLDLARAATLSFEEPDLERFPALRLARWALEAGGGAPTVLNAANEVAVEEFLARRLGFTGIAALVEVTLEAAVAGDLTREPESVDEAISIDHNSRLLAHQLLPEIAAKAF
jgi:1-deoxy-D-xylulose-5-phosphate reductoisomerase